MKTYDLKLEGGLDNPVFRQDSFVYLKEREQQRQQQQQQQQQIDATSEQEWGAALPEMDTGPPWDEMSTKDKVIRVILNTVKVSLVFVLLYFFICSLDLLSSAFKLISGKTTSGIMSGGYLDNPIVGLMVGILLTVLVQSSSTSTSIVVSMVSASMLDVHDAIPIIMGSNVGTSVTNTIVSLTQLGDREVFRRAFAGATVHDMFNWLSVIVMLTIEVATGFLEMLSGKVVGAIAGISSGGEVKILKVITEPFTDLIVQLNGEVLECWGIGQWLNKTSMITEFCEYYDVINDTTSYAPSPAYVSATSSLVTTSTDLELTTFAPGSCTEDPTVVGRPHSCKFLFYETSMSDSQVGIILLIMALVVLCGALICIVKILNSLLKGSIAVVIRKTINADIPYMPWLTGYIALLIGAVMTFIVQSSSIFTSTLTPLIGIGIITVERAYPLTLGSNIGTTTTALMASLAGEGKGLRNGIQIALVHLLFNVSGILIFYPIPFMRFPIPMCKFLGNITATYRWFAVVYLVFMFFLMPLFVFLLSLGGPIVLWSVIAPLLLLLIYVAIINIMQNKWKNRLPKILQTWDFLPEPLRSLKPYDKIMTGLPCCKTCRDADAGPTDVVTDAPNVSTVSTETPSTTKYCDYPSDKKGIDNAALSM